MSKSHWEIADEIARDLMLMAGQAEEGNGQELLTKLAGLAIVVRDTAERVGLRAEGVDHPLEAGQTYTLTLEVEVTVSEVHDSHGLSYEIDLERRDFLDGRTVSVDADEIKSARRH